MLLQLIPQSDTPLYIQVYQQIKDKIIHNELKPHEKLPSRRQMAQTNGISLNTVMHGYNQLIDEGYIYAVERSGYYVEEIDYQIIIAPQSQENKKTVRPSKVNYRYDLVKSQADWSIFPFENLRKIYNDLLKSQSPKLLQVCESFGYQPLRKALASYLDRARGIPCQAEQIVIGPSSQYLFQLLIPLLDQVKSIGIEDPGYISLNKLFTEKGLDIIPLKVDQKGVQIDRLTRLNPDLVYLTPNHQFPTGSILPIDRRIKLLAWSNECDGRYIVEDDYDSEFKYSGIPVPSLKSLDKQNKVIYMGSLSRSLSTSTRISYMVLPDQLASKLSTDYSYLSSANNTLSQLALYKFIDNGDFERHMNTARKHYQEKRDLLIKAIKNQDPNAVIHGEAAGLHILLEPSFKFDPLDLKRKAQDQKINLKLLSDYTIEDKKDNEGVIYLSFSSLPIEEIDNLVEEIYSFM